MGFLTPILQSLGMWLVRALFDEAKELWADKEVKGLAKDSVTYVKDKYFGTSGDIKMDMAKDELKRRLLDAGKDASEHALGHIVEKAVQRYLK
jgi:hypothetical protein